MKRIAWGFFAAKTPEDVCEVIEHEAPPAYNRCVSNAKHKIDPKKAESTCNREGTAGV